jgi:hypothetical protein
MAALKLTDRSVDFSKAAEDPMTHYPPTSARVVFATLTNSDGASASLWTRRSTASPPDTDADTDAAFRLRSVNHMVDHIHIPDVGHIVRLAAPATRWGRKTANIRPLRPARLAPATSRGTPAQQVRKWLETKKGDRSNNAEISKRTFAGNLAYDRPK